MSDGQIEYIEWDREREHQLGRHIRHDERSRAFAAPRRAEPTKDKRHRVWGTRLDQDGIGACTGFTGAGFMNTSYGRALMKAQGIVQPTMKNADGFDFYRGATRRDVWPGEWEPTDTGSSGIAVAQELQARGLISTYEWAFGFQHGLSVITERPLMQGTWWTDDMFNPDADGRVRPTGGDAGGHEYLWVGVELRSTRTRTDNRSWFLNSWGSGWGVNGFFWMTWDDHEDLLERDGDLVTAR